VSAKTACPSRMSALCAASLLTLTASRTEPFATGALMPTRTEGLMAVWRHKVTQKEHSERRHDRSTFAVSFTRTPYCERTWPSQGTMWSRTAADAEAVYRNTRDKIISFASDRRT